MFPTQFPPIQALDNFTIDNYEQLILEQLTVILDC